MSSVVAIDCPPDATGLGLAVCGLPVLERRIRDAARGGASRVVVRGDAAALAPLDAVAASLAVPLERLPPDAPLPAEAERWRADEVAGIRVIDRASLRRAERALMQTCRRPYDGPGDRFVGRSFSLPMTRFLSRTEISPTQVTLVSALIGLAGIGLIARGSHATLAAGGAAFLFSWILDSVDGELARIRFKASRRGMVIDNVSDDLLDNLLVLALGVAVGGPWLWVGLVAAGGRGLVALAIYRAVARLGAPGDVMAFRWWFDRADSSATQTYADLRSPLTWLRSLGRRDTYCLVYGVLCLAGLAHVALGFGAAIAACYGSMMTLHLLRRAA